MRKTPSARRRARRGFTLLEATASAGLLGVVLVGAFNMGAASQNLLQTSSSNSALLNKTRRGLDRAIREGLQPVLAP